MVEIIWSIKLKLTAMLKEIKWNFSLRKYDVKSLKESFSLVFHIFIIHSILVFSDMVKFMQFMKSMISKKLIFIPLIVMFLLFGFYLSFINGKAEHELFQEKIFPKLYYDTAIEIRDPKGRFAGTMAQPQSLVLNPSLFVANPPTLFWSLLKEKYDPYLDFESNATSFYQALFENGAYYNGIDVSAPLEESKKLVVHLLTEQNLNLKPNQTLTQQLINIFLKKHPFEKSSNNVKRLKLAKTFFHELKGNSGANFKAWLLAEKDFFFVDGKGYGFKDCAEIFFGKEVEDLSPAQQAILVAMYANPYQSKLSLNEQKKAWKKIKNEAILVVNGSKVVKNHYTVVSSIKKMLLPKLPYFPDSLMEVVGQITPRNQEQFSSLPTRSDALLNSSKAVINQELDKLFQTYSISPKSRLVTSVGINFDLNSNFYFNHYLKAQIDALNISTFWVSVVNEEGNFIRLYQKNTAHQHPPQIGNIGKIFTALLFADRGDKFYTKYCNKEAKDELPLERGYKKCTSRGWIDSRRLFSSNKMLPLYDGFIKYREQDRRGDNIYYTPIYMQKIEAIYQNLSLIPLQNNEPRADLGAGKLQMTPLDVHVALHKITQLLYNPNRIFYGLKLIKSLEYHEINQSVVAPKSKLFSFDSPEQVSPTFQNFFTKEKRLTLQTLFQSPIYKNYGSLQWLKNYVNVRFVLAQESHKNGVHWLVGVFKKSGKYYSFTIYLENKNLTKHEVKQRIKKILESTIKSINKSRKMKFEYMKQVFRD
jgi:hypothetical protein